MLGLGEESPSHFASQSRPVLGYVAGFIQPPCSRQRMCILVSARLQATAAPDAPAPMISTSSPPVSLSRANILPIDSGASACIRTAAESQATGGMTTGMETYDYIIVGA